MNILIKNADVTLTGGEMRTEKNRYIGIKDGYIDFVTGSEDATKDFKADKIINGKNRLVMPGLVNAHTHSSMTLLRNYADDLPLHEWLFNRIFPAEEKMTGEDIYWGTMLGIAEMIKSGTTAFADMYLQMDYVAKAVIETGIRANLSRSPMVIKSDKDHSLIDESQQCFDFFQKYNGISNGRIKASVEIHSAYLFDKPALKLGADLAKKLGTGIQIHILETMKEREDTIAKYGKNALEVCLECGVLDVPVIAAHCVHMDDNDIDILARKKVSVAHNPTSNLKLGSGIAKIPQIAEKEVNICLGTDGASSNNNLNMFEEMHLAALIHKGSNMDPSIISAAEVIKMGTLNGAKALGWGDTLGQITKGMKADIIMLDIDKPHFYPLNNAASSIVYSAQGSDVDTVIIDGKVVMEGRKLTTIDEELVKCKALKASENITA